MIHISSPEGKLAEKIVDEITPFIKVKPNEMNNKTRVFEKIYYVLRTIHCTRCGGTTFESNS